MYRRTIAWLLLSTMLLTCHAAAVGHAETISYPLPGLIGRYHDDDRNFDAVAKPIQREVAVEGLDLFESIDEIRIRVNGEMVPSVWHFPAAPSGQPNAWTERVGLEIMLHPTDNWQRGAAALMQTTRDLTASTDIIDFDHELAFRRFFVSSFDAAREFDSLRFSRLVRAWKADTSPKPYQVEPGYFDIHSAQLIVDGTLRLKASAPEPSAMALVLCGLLALVALGRTKRVRHE